MPDRREIDNAIAAHAKWKVRLKQAIDTGKIDATVGVIRKDDQCDFGKWLKTLKLSATDPNTPHFNSIRGLHAQFHESAARVAELALGGKKQDAEKAMAYGGDFTGVSSKLTSAMLEWKKSIG